MMGNGVLQVIWHIVWWPAKSLHERCISINIHLKFTINFYRNSAGIGRTATFIAIDILLQHARDDQVVDVKTCVHNMRKSRAKMVNSAVRILDKFNKSLSYTRPYDFIRMGFWSTTIVIIRLKLSRNLVLQSHCLQ